MRREERPFEGWSYKQEGQAFGPVPAKRLQELLAAGRLQPRQAVWRRSRSGLLFVHAATAASETMAPRAGHGPPSGDRLECCVFGALPRTSAAGDGADAQGG